MRKGLMSNMMPRDIIAIITLIGGFLLLSLGINGVVGSMLMGVVMFYFGAEVLEKRKRNNVE